MVGNRQRNGMDSAKEKIRRVTNASLTGGGLRLGLISGPCHRLSSTHAEVEEAKEGDPEFFHCCSSLGNARATEPKHQSHYPQDNAISPAQDEALGDRLHELLLPQQPGAHTYARTRIRTGRSLFGSEHTNRTMARLLGIGLPELADEALLQREGSHGPGVRCNFADDLASLLPE